MRLLCIGRNGGGALRLPGPLALDGGLDLGFHPGLRAVMVGGFALKHIRLSKSQECVVPERIEHWPGSPVSPDRSHQMIMGPEVGSRLATPMNLKHSLPRWFGAPRSTIAIESREWWIISPRPRATGGYCLPAEQTEKEHEFHSFGAGHGLEGQPRSRDRGLDKRVPIPIKPCTRARPAR